MSIGIQIVCKTEGLKLLHLIVAVMNIAAVKMDISKRVHYCVTTSVKLEKS
jgi:hypothetical protein